MPYVAKNIPTLVPEISSLLGSSQIRSTLSSTFRQHFDRPPDACHFRASTHTNMSGVLRAAAPLARRLNAVPKGPVTRATRGMACAFQPARA